MYHISRILNARPILDPARLFRHMLWRSRRSLKLPELALLTNNSENRNGTATFTTIIKKILRETNTNTARGRVVEAAESLMKMSN